MNDYLETQNFIKKHCIKPLQAQQICGIIPSTLEAICNTGYIHKFYDGAQFYYYKVEINCLVGINAGNVLGYNGSAALVDTCELLEQKLSTVKIPVIKTPDDLPF